mgnify:CR=1 FL=1
MTVRLVVEDSGEAVMRPGDAAAFKAGVTNGHHLVNRSRADAVFLVVGTRAKSERGHYSEVDLLYLKDNGVVRFTRRSGEPLEEQ